MASLLGAPLAAQGMGFEARESFWPGTGVSVSTPAVIAASAVLPGSGQALEGRWLAAAIFAAVEVGGWWLHLDARGDGRRFRDGYRDLAWDVARGRPLPRVDGSFEYYERMLRWTRSGRFDADPAAPDVQPERAPDTFNGRQWRLAAEIFLGGDVAAPPSAPGYASALAYYRERAYGEGLLWDWTGREPEQARFGALIDDSDDAFRRASIAAGAVVANHVLSAVEAFVSRRLGGRAVEFSLIPHPGTFSIRIPMAR